MVFLCLRILFGSTGVFENGIIEIDTKIRNKQAMFGAYKNISDPALLYMLSIDG